MAWKSAAGQLPAPADRVVDHLGLIDGVTTASSTRLTELWEDYPRIDLALEPLRRQFVPIQKEDLFSLWQKDTILANARETALSKNTLACIPPLGLGSAPSLAQSFKFVLVRLASQGL
jgi:hypothetical protein